jgi:glucose-1-phosphate cytidylyltransferase
MKVVILCGGLGTRLKEETEFRPKPLVQIGEKPILWHIMKIFSHYGYNDFILCLGYKGEMIKEYFLNYDYMNSDFTMGLGYKKDAKFYGNHCESDWKVTLANTGVDTNTGGRIKRIEKYIGKDETFLAAYGDGVADIDLKKLIEHHRKKGKTATLTGVHPYSRFGVVEAGADDIVNGFKEKPRMDGWANVGFFVFQRQIFDYLEDNSVLETKPLETLSQKSQLTIYRHQGFWQCMDTFKDQKVIQGLWDTGKPPWKVWND